MTEGRHYYWEVELTWTGGDCYIFVGAARPGLDHDTGHDTTDGGIPLRERQAER